MEKSIGIADRRYRGRSCRIPFYRLQVLEQIDISKFLTVLKAAPANSFVFFSALIFKKQLYFVGAASLNDVVIFGDISKKIVL
jgi:hypothetical protein